MALDLSLLSPFEIQLLDGQKLDYMMLERLENNEFVVRMECLGYWGMDTSYYSYDVQYKYEPEDDSETASDITVYVLREDS